jgi:hypothetical protein
MRLSKYLFLMLAVVQTAFAASPDCSHPDDWAAKMAFVHLKNAGLVNSETNDFSKTKVIRLASEKTGKDLYRQIHKVIFTDKLGNTIEVITINDASQVECSMGGVEVLLVSKDLGDLNQ